MTALFKYDPTTNTITENLNKTTSTSNFGFFSGSNSRQQVMFLITHNGPATKEGFQTVGSWSMRYITVNSTSTTNTYPIDVRSVSETAATLQAVFSDADAPDPIHPTDTDPYSPGGNSAPGGGNGVLDNDSDAIDFPNLPTISAIDTGFLTLFNPSLSEIRDLANFMWGPFDLDNWRRLFVDPMDAILGLSIVPVNVPDAGQREVIIGNARTNINMNLAAQQWVEKDCGDMDVVERWKGYLDYDPYTKAEIYLPFIGTRPLAVDDVMGKNIHVKYHIDLITGACVAYVKSDVIGGKKSVLYTFVGQCASNIPINGGDWTNTMNGILQIAAAIGTMVATEGASIPVTMAAAGAAASGMVNAMRPNIERSAAMSGTGGLLAVQYPYLILTRPNQCVPEYQNKYQGYPSFITAALSDLSGFTVIESIEIAGIKATDAELSEIESLLKSGVIF